MERAGARGFRFFENATLSKGSDLFLVMGDGTAIVGAIPWSDHLLSFSRTVFVILLRILSNSLAF